MKLTRQKILKALGADRVSDGNEVLIINALRYQEAADAAWLDCDFALFHKMERELRAILFKLDIFNSSKNGTPVKSDDLKKHFSGKKTKPPKIKQTKNPTINPTTWKLKGKKIKDQDPTEGEHYLHHFKRAFVGCFAVFHKAKCQYERLRKWKDKPLADPDFTEYMAASMAPYCTNKYDYVTAAVPNKTRKDLASYCTYLLGKAVADKLNTPFIPAFARRLNKASHGKHAALRSTDLPVLLPEAISTLKNKNVLFVDDFINTTKTARECYKELRKLNCSVSGIIYAYF